MCLKAAGSGYRCVSQEGKQCASPSEGKAKCSIPSLVVFLRVGYLRVFARPTGQDVSPPPHHCALVPPSGGQEVTWEEVLPDLPRAMEPAGSQR